MKTFKHRVRSYLIAGILVWVPIWVTFVVIRFIVDLMDKTLDLLPRAYRPDTLLGMHIPGLGLIFTVVILFVTGLLVTNFLGHKLVNLWERILARIPLVRTIYTSVKQVLHTIFSASDESFRKVLLVEYPRKGLWSVAFQTSSGFRQAEKHVGEELITIFIPTTPNPTSGFLMFIPRNEAIELDISVDEALKVVISLGVVLPKSRPTVEVVTEKTL